MATHAPTTGAPAGAREITGWTVSLQAARATGLLGHVTVLADSIRRFADDMTPIEDAAQLHFVNCICSLAETIDFVVEKAGEIVETIELDARALQPEGH